MAGVTFDTTVGGDGSTVTDDANATTGLANGGHRVRLVPAFSQFVAIAVWVKTRALEVLGYKNAAATSASNAAASETAAAASAASAAAIAGAFVGTSATSWTPTIGPQVFATQTGEQYTPGTFLSLVSAAAPTAWGVGQVSSYTGSTLTMDIQVVNGSGVHTDWNISLTGTRGPEGPPAPPPSPTAFTNLIIAG